MCFPHFSNPLFFVSEEFQLMFFDDEMEVIAGVRLCVSGSLGVECDSMFLKIYDY